MFVLREDPTMAQHIRDAVALAGTGLIGYGAWLWWPPAGFMGAGALLVAVWLVGSLRSGR